MPTPDSNRKIHAAYETARSRIETCRTGGGPILDLSHLGLSKLPPGIGQLTSLTTLSLAQNKLDSLPPEIGLLTQLEELYVGNNQLQTLPGEIAGLKFLKELDLSNNKLFTLPPEIGSLKSLKSLDVSNNRLINLPSELRDLVILKSINLVGNDKLEIPLEILGDSTKRGGYSSVKSSSPRTILDYFFSRQRRGRPLQEVKLLLVGRGESGKSSVSLRLRENWFESALKETPGIDIRPWKIVCAKGDVKAHLWDFAGQEITHETHRFFLSQRSLYLVVLDGRGGQQMEEADYWLGHVRKYGATIQGDVKLHSPVIVVLNKWHSPGAYDVERRRLRREHPNIVAFVETDCEDGWGVDDLKKAIRKVVEQMPAVWQNWPESYFKVREMLLFLATHKEASQRKHFLPWQEYQKVCESCGVWGLESQTALAENLNALGIALYYGSDERLRDTRVLDPNWAANGLYGLVRGVQRRPWRGRNGYLHASEVEKVLEVGLTGMNPERCATMTDYPKVKDGVKVHEFLLDLMLDRELGFQASGDQKADALYLLPGLLTVDEPEVKEFDVALHIDGSQVRFRYLYELLPAGIMSRFIVRTHALSEAGFRWQRGVVLNWGDASALVLAERRKNPRVDVFIRGGSADERQQLAGVVRSNMDEIHQGLPEGLWGREQLDLNILGERYEDMSKLESLELAQQPVQVVTVNGPQNLPVTPQLEKVQPASARTKGAPKLKVFISYAHNDYRLWDALQTHLSILKNENLIDWWFDGQIRPGTAWDNSIREELKLADIVVLMLSNAFFASNYIQGVELATALQQMNMGKTKILPVLLEPTEAFSVHPSLGILQAVPSINGRLRALTTFTPRITGWNEVQKALRRMILEKSSGSPKKNLQFEFPLTS